MRYLNLAMKNTEDMEEKFYNQARKLAKEIKTMNVLLNEHEHIITQQGLEFTKIRKENTRVNAIVSNPQPGDHSLNPTVQSRLELLVSQNENMKESQNIMAGEMAEMRKENQKILEFYTEARGHMMEQAKQIESRDEELTTLR